MLPLDDGELALAHTAMLASLVRLPLHLVQIDTRPRHRGQAPPLVRGYGVETGVGTRPKIVTLLVVVVSCSRI